MLLIKKLWAAKDRAKLTEIQGDGEVYSITFSPDAKHVVGGGQSRTVGQWQVDDGREVGEPMEVANYLLNIAVSKDGRLIACGGSCGLAEIWDMQTHKKVVHLEADATRSRVFAVDVSPDSTRFATGADQNVSVWSISTGQLFLGPLKHANSIAAVKFSPSGDRIATATWERNSIRLYDSSNGQLLVDIPDRVSSPYNTSLAWSNDGRQLFVASYTGKIKCFHVSGSLLSWVEWIVQTDNRPASIALAGNGTFIAYASSRFVSFWDTSTYTQIGPVVKHSQRVWSIALSNDGHLASGGDDEKITLRNLRDILPQSYFFDPSSFSSESQTSSQSAIVQQNSSLTEVHRLEIRLSEKDKTIQESRKEKDNLEQKIQSLSTALRTQEKDLDQLKQEISNLKVTVRGLRTQLSDVQETTRRLESECQRLTKRLDATYESADQHKLEAERIKAAFDELKVKHETELSQTQRSVFGDPEMVAKSRNRGTGIDVFESWMQERSINANTVSLEEIKNHPTTDYNALACCAFVLARSRNWSAAYDEAQKSINIQSSAIGHIAKATALVGQEDYKAAMRAFALVFRDGDPNENELMLVIWSILSCLAGEYIDGVLRVHDLVNTTQADKATRDRVQAYMYVLLGNRYMKEGGHERAMQLFDHARASCSSHQSRRLEIISLISGWCFDGLEITAQQHLCEALYAAGRTKDAAVDLLEVNNYFGRED